MVTEGKSFGRTAGDFPRVRGRRKRKTKTGHNHNSMAASDEKKPGCNKDRKCIPWKDSVDHQVLLLKHVFQRGLHRASTPDRTKSWEALAEDLGKEEIFQPFTRIHGQQCRLKFEALMPELLERVKVFKNSQEFHSGQSELSPFLDTALQIAEDLEAEDSKKTQTQRGSASNPHLGIIGDELMTQELLRCAAASPAAQKKKTSDGEDKLAPKSQSAEKTKKRSLPLPHQIEIQMASLLSKLAEQTMQPQAPSVSSSEPAESPESRKFKQVMARIEKFVDSEQLSIHDSLLFIQLASDQQQLDLMANLPDRFLVEWIRDQVRSKHQRTLE